MEDVVLQHTGGWQELGDARPSAEERAAVRDRALARGAQR